MVGGHEVAEQRQGAGALDADDLLLLGNLEVGRAADVGGGLVPGEGGAGTGVDGAPGGVPLEQARSAVGVDLGREHVGEHGLDLFGGGQDVRKHHGGAVRGLAERRHGEVDVDRACDGIGHHEGGLRQEVLRHVGRDATVEVAIARKHARKLHLRGQGLQAAQNLSGVADAAHAAKAAGVEAKRGKLVEEARTLEDAGRGMAAGGEDALDPGLCGKARGVRLLGAQACGDHHRRVGGGGAARDGGDGQRSVPELVVVPVWAGDVPGLVHVTVAVLGRHALEALLEAGGRHAVVRARRAGEAQLHRREVKLDHTRVVAAGDAAKDALGLGVCLDEGDLGGIATGEAQVVEDVAVDWEERGGGAVLGRHVGDAGALGDRKRRDALAERLDEAANDALGAQALGDREGEVHGRDAVGELAGEVQSHDLGHAHGDGLAQGRGLGLDAADAPAEHADAVGRGRVGVGADERVEAGELALARIEGVGGDDLAEALDVELVADAAAGRHDAHVVERLARPLEEGEALAVALGLDGEVLGSRARAARDVGGDAVVDDEGARDARVHAGRVSPTLDHGVAHRGEVDEDRHAREVLEQHARGHEHDLFAGGAGAGGLDHARGTLDGLLVAGGPAHDVLEKGDQARRQGLGAGDGRNVDHAPRDAASLEGLDLARLDYGISERRFAHVRHASC